MRPDPGSASSDFCERSGRSAPAATLLSLLGDRDGAFAQALLYRPADPITPPYLFLPQTALVRANPRFMALAQGLGFVRYWSSTGNWPDFCAEPGLPHDCKAEAARLPKSA